jgi:hypothetical protein
VAMAVTVPVDIPLPLNLTDAVLANSTNALGKLGQAKHIILYCC